MKIRFKKGKKGTDVLECIRKDGSISWTKVYPGLMIHEMIHFVVETELKFKQAFYGIIAQGYDIADFEVPRAQRAENLIPKNLAEEAHISEILVGALQNAYLQPIENIREVIRDIFVQRAIPIDILQRMDFEELQRKIAEMGQQWYVLPEGEALEKEFEEGSY